MSREKSINAFLDFCKAKYIQLGGDVTSGYGLERTEFRPLHPDDYQVIIDDFIASNPGPEPEEMVEIKIDGQEILDILAVQKAKLLIDQSNSNELIKDWVREELNTHRHIMQRSLVAAVLINVAVLVVTAAIILY